MTDTVHRELDLPCSPHEAWEHVIDPSWLGDDGELPTTPGSEGWISEGDDVHYVIVEEVEEGNRLVYDWATFAENAEDALVSRQAIVKHLQLLATSGLAIATRDGREVRYRASTGAAQHASTWLSVRASAWDRRLDALEKGVRDANDSKTSTSRR